MQQITPDRGSCMLQVVRSPSCYPLSTKGWYLHGPAGRHERVPAEVLREALHFLKYSYSVYSLQPKSE